MIPISGHRLATAKPSGQPSKSAGERWKIARVMNEGAEKSPNTMIGNRRVMPSRDNSEQRNLGSPDWTANIGYVGGPALGVADTSMCRSQSM